MRLTERPLAPPAARGYRERGRGGDADEDAGDSAFAEVASVGSISGALID